MEKKRRPYKGDSSADEKKNGSVLGERGRRRTSSWGRKKNGTKTPRKKGWGQAKRHTLMERGGDETATERRKTVDF